jgi:hypothetical protein
MLQLTNEFKTLLTRRMMSETNSDNAPIQQPTIELIKTKEYSNVDKVPKQECLTDDNWHDWKEHIACVFDVSDIEGYVNGTTKCPKRVQDPVGAMNWSKNDHWAQKVIMDNVTTSQMSHIRSKTSAKVMYSALSTIHESKAHQMVTHIENQLYETKASEGDNIVKHLKTIKDLRDRLNTYEYTEFHVPDNSSLLSPIP